MRRVTHWPSSLALVRHGESVGNVAREQAEATGLPVIDIVERDMDVPLSGRGREQAAALGRWLGELPRRERPTVAISSPYVRARETAEIAVDAAAMRVPLVLDERLREREFGVLDRLTKAGIVARHPDQAEARARVGKFYHRPPGGESWCDVALRVRSSLDSITREYGGEHVLIVAHQVVITMFRYVIEGLTEREILELDRAHELANCSVTSYVSVGRRGACAACAASASTRSSRSSKATRPSRQNRMFPLLPADSPAGEPTERLVDAALLRSMPLPALDGDATKRGRGTALIVGGSAETPGGALLAAVVALRMGAGKVQIATVGSVATALAVAVPEARVLALPETAEGTIARSAACPLTAALARGRRGSHRDEHARLGRDRSVADGDDPARQRIVDGDHRRRRHPRAARRASPAAADRRAHHRDPEPVRDVRAPVNSGGRDLQPTLRCSRGGGGAPSAASSRCVMR